MHKWVAMLVLLASVDVAAAQNCSDLAQVELTPKQVGLPHLALPGDGRWQFGLGEGAATFVHSNDLLLVRYRDGSLLSHRELDSSEMWTRLRPSDGIALADFVRLIFEGDSGTVSATAREEAKLHREAILPGCTALTHYQLSGLDAYGYAQTRTNGERYHALFLLDGQRVHYVDITGSDALAEQVVSTLSKRN